MFAPLWNTIKRELRRLTSRRIYVTMMLIVPMLTALFYGEMSEPKERKVKSRPANAELAAKA